MTKATTEAPTAYRYTFKRHIPIDDIADTLTLSVLGVEHLHGRSKIRRDGWWRLDRQRRVCIIDASTAVGVEIAKLFAGNLGRELGENVFSVTSTGPKVLRREHR